MRRIKSMLPSPAMIVACVALVAALGGTAYAAFLPKNSVGSRELKANAVKTQDITPQAVSAAKIKNGAITDLKYADGSIASAKLKAGAVGTAQLGDGSVTTGKLGDRSVKLGKLGITVVTHYADAPLPDDGTIGFAIAQCNSDEVLISGGSSFSIPDTAPSGTTLGDDIQLLASRPAVIIPGPGGDFPADGSGLNAWRASARNPSIGAGNTPAVQITALAVCLKDTTTP